MTADASAVTELVRGRIMPISLEQMNARAALQTRVDSKYLLTLDDLDALVSRVRNHVDVLEIHGRLGQTYDTVYFDSPDLRSYRDHLQRRRQTYKLRSRVYVGSGLQVFEVKMRDGRGNTVKRKIDHRDCAPDEVGATAAAFCRRVIHQEYGFDLDHPVEPSLRNRYARLSLASRTSEERTTVDFDLHMLRGDDVRASMHKGLILVETKSAHGRGGMDRTLWSMGIRPVRVSKYCLGIALLDPELRVNRYARAMRRMFGAAATPAGPLLPPVPAMAVTLDGPPRAPRAVRAARAPRPAR